MKFCIHQLLYRTWLSGLMLIFPLVIMSTIFVRPATFKCMISRLVRQYLTDEAAVLVANALVSSCLDYCNSLFRSLSSFNMRKLQCIQNTLGRIVTNYNRYSQATSILKKTHWLPVEFWCIFKTATLVFLHSGHPSYFSPHLSTHCGRYGTRYNHPDKRFLEVNQYCPSVHKSKKTLRSQFCF